MGKIRTDSGRAVSIPTGLAIGIAISLISTLGASAIIAKLIDNGKLPMEKVGYGIMITVILSAAAGAITAVRFIKHRNRLIALASGTGYCLCLLIINALCFGGSYQGVPETGLLVLCGAMLPTFFGKKGRGSASVKRIRQSIR